MSKKITKKIAKKENKSEKIDKVWYCIEDFDNPEGGPIYPFESIAHAVKDWTTENTAEPKDNLYLYEVRLLGKVKVETKTTYEIKQ